MPLETDKRNGFKLLLREEINTGLWPNNFATRIPMWETGQNVQFTELGVSKVSGCTERFDSTSGGPIRGIQQNLEEGVDVLYYGDLTTLYRWDSFDNIVDVVGTGYNATEDAGSTLWDMGGTTWDGGSTVWDDGAIRSSFWSMVSYGDIILATNGIDPPQIKITNETFNDLPGGVVLITITAAGSGYTLGDPVTVVGGGGAGFTAEVSEVGGGGEILSIRITDAGSDFTSNPTVNIGGTGAGATATAQIGLMDVQTVVLFAKRGPHVLGFNTSFDDREFIWSSADDPTDWIPTTTNSAGSLRIRELDSQIIAAVPLGDRIAVYGEDQMFLVNYISAPFYFGYDPALNGVGAVSGRAIVPVGRKHYGLSNQGFFVTDGVTFEYIDQPQVRKYYLETVTRSQLSKVNAYHNEDNNEVVFFYPAEDNVPSRALVYNYRNGNWSILGFGRSFSDERLAFSTPIAGAESGEILFEGETENANGEPIDAYVRTKPLDLGDAWRVKEIDTLRVGYTGTDQLTYRIGWSDTENATINWEDYASLPSGYDQINVRTAGRWLHFELRSDALNATWEASSIDVLGRLEAPR